MCPTPETDDQPDYVGKELELFELAKNWKRYLSTRLQPFLAGEVLEVGAGLGANVPYFYRDDLTRWLSLEPDGQLCTNYHLRQADGQIPTQCELTQGVLATLSEKETFDSIIYIDVLEHIKEDRAEFERAYQRLRPRGHLVVLCPAHNFLFSPFDQAIGHYRRYNKRMFCQLSDQRPVVLEYLDIVGMFASIVNKLLLRQSYPNEKQIMLWDRLFVPISRLIDPLVLRSSGKSILGVWRKRSD